MARVIIKRTGDLGEELALAPERHVAAALSARGGLGVALDALVVERGERLAPRELPGAIVLDTTHARDGIIDLRAARAAQAATSTKKRVREGDILVSRLRPYLRQIAYAHPAVMRACGDAPLACSTEFYVLSPRDGAGELAFLVPLLLSAPVQHALAAGQEGGHHPRVPPETLLQVRFSRAELARRDASSRRVREALDALYDAMARFAAVLGA